MTSTLLSSRDAGTDKQETFRLELLRPSDGVGVVRITAINDDITLLEVGDELLNEGVNSISSFNKEDDFARLLQLGNEFLNGMGTLNICACRANFSLNNPQDEKGAKQNTRPFASLARK